MKASYPAWSNTNPSGSDPKLASLLPVSQTSIPQKPKLILAQNNPHLKSHRRRQSSVMPSADDMWVEKRKNLPGQHTPGMEHTKQLGDILYSKWVEGLRNRWPALGWRLDSSSTGMIFSSPYILRSLYPAFAQVQRCHAEQVPSGDQERIYPLIVAQVSA